MELKKLHDRIYDEVIEAGFDALSQAGDDIHGFTCIVELGQGAIHVAIYKKSQPIVEVIHDDDTKTNECPLLAQAIAKELPTFDHVLERWKEDNIEDDIWQRNGFRNEADYLRYRYGN